MHSSTKQCFKCEKVKPVDDFYRHPMMADGRLGKCKECTKSDSAKHRSENIEKVRAYDRDRAKNKHRKVAAAEHSKRWRQEDSRRTRAHNAVARALRSGKLVKKNCERCGSEKSMAHHDNYDEPLKVTWLCQPDHKQRHKELALAGIDP